MKLYITETSPYARIARAEALTIRRSEFILAAQVQGASTAGILYRHVMPLCVSSVIVRLTLDMAPNGVTDSFDCVVVKTAVRHFKKVR